MASEPGRARTEEVSPGKSQDLGLPSVGVGMLEGACL